MQVIDGSGYKQMTIDDVKTDFEEESDDRSDDEKTAFTQPLGYGVMPDDVFKPLLVKAMDLCASDKVETEKKKRGQRGKGKKEAAVSVSLRIPADVLKMIDDKAAFNGMDRTAMILSILERGY